MFDRVVVVSLARRPQRWKRFLDHQPRYWPFRPVELWQAVDGREEELPAWYGHDPTWRKKLRGAWGCFQSHLAIWREALDRGQESVLVFEDDAVFCTDFPRRVGVFLDSVPDDWDQIYLGGQHIYTDRDPPVRVNDDVVQGRCVNRTHAYAMRRPMLERCVERFGGEWTGKHLRDWHIDWQLSYMHLDRKATAYCPTRWLVGQSEGPSDCDGGAHMRPVFWNEFGIVEPSPC